MLRLRKLMQVACTATVALTVFSCSQDEFEMTNGKGNTAAITATFEGVGSNTRTTVNDQYQIVWQESDALALFCTDNSKTSLSYQDGKGTTSATFTGSVESGKTASFSVYPDQENMSASNNTLTMTLPATLEKYAGSSNGPMYAKVTDADNLSALSFKHMAALIKLTVNKIPTDATTFKVTASNNIAGTCTADLSADYPVLIVKDEGASKTITATFDASSSVTSRSFYIPLPVGTYQFITAELTNGNDKVYFTKTLNNKTLNRRDLLEVPALDCVTVEATTPTALNEALESSDNLPQTAPEDKITTDIAITGDFATASENAEIKIPVVANSDINLAFQSVPATSGGALQLTDKNKENQTTPAETATNKVSLAIPEVSDDGTSAPSVAIDMPRTTVTLSAVGAKATYNEVTVTTAKQTLVVNAGVTVKKLIIKGGNVEIYGIVEELVRENGNVEIVEVASFEAASIKTVTNPEHFKFTSTWDGISQIEATNGNIYTAAQLAYYQSKIAPNNVNYQSLPVTLTAGTTTLYTDVDLANKPWLGMVINGNTFDGNNHTIKNLNMSQYIMNQQETKYTPQACIGLFAVVYGAATIKDITLDKVTIHPDASVSPKWVGALVGYSRGNVTKYENCVARNVDIFTHGATSYRVGGLIGYIEACGAANNTATATLKSCKVENATIAASFGYGGLVGSMYDSVTFEDCSTKDITLSLNGECDNTYGYVSGFIGDIANSGTKARTIIIKNCTADALTNETALKVPMGGCKWCGIVEPESVPNFTIKVTDNNESEKTLVAGTDFNKVYNIPWDGSSSFEPKYENNTYTITAPSELAWIAKQVEKDNTFDGKNILLSADLDMGNKNWKPIGDNSAHKTINMDKQEAEYVKTVKYFKGTFDGNNKTISNLMVNHKYPGAGLFGNVQNAIIKNLNVTNATINGSSKWTAVIIGFSNGSLTVENVKVSNSEINMGSDADGAVKLAGIVSYMNGNNTEDIHLKGCSVSDFTIDGGSYNIAGLAGYIIKAKSFIIENCQTSNITLKVSDAKYANRVNYSSAFFGCFGVTASKQASSVVFKNNTVSGTYTYDGTAVNLGSFTISDAGKADDSDYNTFVCAPLFGDCDATSMDITIDGKVYTYNNGKYIQKQN